MSTLKANAINNISASVGGITIDSSGTVSGALPSPNRNLLYNGAMQISQRGTSSTAITTGGYRTADRWNSDIVSLGTWTQDIQNDAPTGSGFRRSLRMLCTTADAAPSASDNLWLVQSLEGQDCQRIAKGTPLAKTLTLSFWVKSNVTGTYVAFLFDNDNTRSVSASYTISATNTWEKKVITFPADTIGVLDNDNGDSFRVYFGLAAGSNFTSGTLARAWGPYSAANVAVGQVNVAAAINNYWQITGVQLETGDATEFEFKSFGQELRECQRYYRIVRGIIGAGNSTTQIAATVSFDTMRAAPNPGLQGVIQVSDGTTDFTQSSATITNLGTTDNNSFFFLSNFTGLTVNRAYIGSRNAANTNGITLSAEL